MKRVMLFIVLLMVALQVNAQDNVHKCIMQSGLFEAAAAARDNGLSPKEALVFVNGFTEIPLSARKKAINLVYFDKDFAYPREALRRAVFDFCMYGPSKYKPLK